MYELNRVRLVAAGPRGARYDQVLLDFSGTGKAVGGASLFGGERRPSPASLLLLENGGGKSVLLRLIFSVMLPGARKVIGDAGGLEKFVVGDSPAHVVLEWMNVRDGKRLLVGKTMQHRAGATGNLAQAWWMLRVVDGVSLDTLPFDTDGRRMRLDGVKQALVELQAQHPGVDRQWTDAPGEWTRLLRERGLEPDLFDIQRTMNADEGDAANAFQYKSSRDFVEQLLRQTADTEALRSIADNFHEHAQFLANRDSIIRESDFAAGAIERLRVAATAHAEHNTATQLADTAAGALASHHQAVARRAAVDTAKASSLETDRDAAQRDVEAHNADRDRANDTLREVQRQTTLLEIAAHTRVVQDNTDVADDAQLTIDALEATRLLERLAEAEALAAAFEREIAEQTAAARPAQHARDLAGIYLIGKLTAEADAARADARAKEQLSTTLTVQADAYQADASRLHGELGGLRGRLTALSEQLAAADQHVMDAVGRGDLAPGTEAGPDVKAATDDAAAAASEAAELLRRHRDRRTALNQQVRAADGHAREAATVATRARQAQQRTEETLTGIQDEAVALGADPFVRAALETADDEVLSAGDIDAHAEPLGECLAVDAIARTARLITDRGAAAELQRLIDSLSGSGLLPARADVDAALAVLHDAKVAAHAGWTYLAEACSAPARPGRVAAQPQLADGIVVDVSALGAAEQVLSSAQLLPAAAVTVGSTAALLGEASPGGQFVIEANPAMYDVDAARSRMLAVAAELEGVNERIRTLSGAEQRSGDAASSLRAWRGRTPVGHLQALRSMAEEQNRQAVLLEQAATDAADTADGARTELDELHATIVAQEGRTGTAQALAGRLTALADVVTAAAAGREEAAGLPRRIETHAQKAADAQEQQSLATSQAKEAARAAENAASLAVRHSESAAAVNITDRTALTGALDTAAGEPTLSLPQLQANYLAAEEAYRAVEVGQDLRQRADGAADTAVDARSDVGALREPVRERASELLGGASGSDPAARQAAVSAARRAHTTALAVAAEARAQMAVLEARIVERYTPEGRNVFAVLPDERVPTSVEHGRRIEAVVAAEHAAAGRAEQQAIVKHRVLVKAHRDASEAARMFTELTRRMVTMLTSVGGADIPADSGPAVTDGARGGGPIVMWESSFAEADSRADTFLDDVGTARKLTDAANSAAGEAADAVSRHARSQQYAALSTPVRQQLAEAERVGVLVRAQEYADALTSRLASLLRDLDNADRYRKLLVDALASRVDGALATLRRASELSTLPTGLDDWTGKRFLQIRFSQPDAAQVTAAVGTVIDALATQHVTREQAARGNSPLRDGMRLLLAGVDAAVPRGFDGISVDVLKPDKVLRDERVPVADMHAVFSGGQELTAAIILYCTFAALRGNTRGRMSSSSHNGVLFLDNPIGKASATYLLELQQRVADKLGVQLVYTTGIKDHASMKQFPLWIRLHNDADRRAGLKYIRVTEQVRQEIIGQLGAEDQLDHVQASRVHLREPAVVGSSAGT